MPNRHVLLRFLTAPAESDRHRPGRRSRILGAMLAAILALTLGMLSTAPAHAASRGAGFGTWAPSSAFGWHGSMLVNGVHTYCITPGAPTPTGSTTDRGISTTAGGLSPTQLTGINLLVSKYGQTTDPVQAAAVSWAVKAVANWTKTLRAYGYRGDSLAGAVNWTFSSLSPQHNQAVQQKAVAYYSEATRVKPLTTTTSVRLTTDAADPMAGTVRVDASVTAKGTLTLKNAVFVSTGTATLTGAATGTTYPIRSTPSEAAAPVTVSVTGRFTAGPAAAVRHFTTPNMQDTAGPGGNAVLEAKGSDAAPRVAPFSPTITTKVATPYSAGGTFIDEVTVGADPNTWPRANGGFAVLLAEAAVYRTPVAPVEGAAMPEDAELVGRLDLATTPEQGPGDYRVESKWAMEQPGFYTAVWEIRRDEQGPEVAERLATDFSWIERWGVPSQIVMVPDITTRAQPDGRTGESISDTIVVRGPLPSGGLTVTSTAYRAVDGVDPADTCVPENLIWASEAVHVDEPGEVVVTSPAIEVAGTYYWQERAVDGEGSLVHEGECGIENETSRVAAPAPIPSPTPTITPNPTPTLIPPALPPTEEPPLATGQLPATGLDDDVLRALAAGAVVLLTAGITLTVIRRRRFGAQRPIG